MVLKVSKATELYEIDISVHTKLLGYKNVEELYDNMMIKGNLHQFKVPTLHISADDDQIFTNTSIPIDEAIA